MKRDQNGRGVLRLAGRLATVLAIMLAVGGALRTAPANAQALAGPVANPDEYSTPHGVPVTVPAHGVLENDTLPGGFAAWGANYGNQLPFAGSLNLNVDGSFTYTPNSNFAGDDAFEYAIFPNEGEPVAATFGGVLIHVTNQLAQPQDDNYTTVKDTGLDVTPDGVLHNDVSPDGDPIEVFGISTDPTHGAVSIHPDGSFQYLPQPGYVGTDSFDYMVIDSFQLSDVQKTGVTKKPIATVNITITEPPTPTETATAEPTLTATLPAADVTETPPDPTATEIVPTPTDDATGGVTELPNTGVAPGNGSDSNVLAACLLALTIAAVAFSFRRRFRLF
jgi:hypothetical protein